MQIQQDKLRKLSHGFRRNLAYPAYLKFITLYFNKVHQAQLIQMGIVGKIAEFQTKSKTGNAVFRLLPGAGRYFPVYYAY